MAWALLAVVMVAWGGALQAWFANDDFLWLDVSHLRQVAASFVGSAGVMNAFRPIVRVSFLIDWFLFGDQAASWHLVNLALHQACAWLFWLLVSRWLGAWPAALAALLFAASPLLQENVIWISGRSGMLGCLFGLISLLCFVRYLRAPNARWLVALIAADLAALASYEAMIVLPLFHLGIAFRTAGGSPRRMCWRPLAWLIAAHVMLAVYRRLVLGSHISYEFRPISVQGLADLARDYWPFLHQLQVPLRVLLVSAVALFARRNRDLASAALWVLSGVLLVMLPFVMFQGVASRYFYLAMLGVALLLVVLIQAIARLLPRGVGFGFTLLIVAVLLVREIGRAEAETADWVAAGRLGQDLIAKIAAVDPNPDPNALHVVLNLPVLDGDGELFFTYPDRAIRRFSRLPFDALLGGHQIVRLAGGAELTYLRKTIAVEDQWRASQQMPPLTCLDTELAAASTPAMFLHDASRCGLDVLSVKNGEVQRASMSEFWAWYQQKTPKG